MVIPYQSYWTNILLICIGMFLYAKLIMENLYNQSTQMSLMKELESDKLPLGLEEAYVRSARYQSTYDN
jgi:hypothetical protein